MADEELDSYIATMQTSYRDIQPDKMSVDPLITTYDYCRPQTTTPSPEFAVTDYFTTHEEEEKPPTPPPPPPPTVTPVPEVEQQQAPPKPVEQPPVQNSISEVIKKRVRKPVNRDSLGYVEHPKPKARRRNSAQKSTAEIVKVIEPLPPTSEEESGKVELNQDDLAALDPTVSTFDDTMMPPLYEEPKTDTDSEFVDSSDDDTKQKPVVDTDQTPILPVINGNVSNVKTADPIENTKVTKKSTTKKPAQRKRTTTKLAPKQTTTTRRKSITKTTIKTTTQSTQTDQLIEPVAFQSTTINDLKEAHRQEIDKLTQQHIKERLAFFEAKSELQAKLVVMQERLIEALSK